MAKKLFKPQKGQVDYTNIRWTPVINCVLSYKNKILVVQRNDDFDFYPGYWNGISGFLDDNKSLREKVLEEIKEEVGITGSDIRKIYLGEIFNQEETKYKKTWIVHPILVETKTDKVKINWEAKDYKWVSLQEAKKLRLLPGFENVLEMLSKYINE